MADTAPRKARLTVLLTRARNDLDRAIDALAEGNRFAVGADVQRALTTLGTIDGTETD